MSRYNLPNSEDFGDFSRNKKQKNSSKSLKSESDFQNKNKHGANKKQKNSSKPLKSENDFQNKNKHGAPERQEMFTNSYQDSFLRINSFWVCMILVAIVFIVPLFFGVRIGDIPNFWDRLLLYVIQMFLVNLMFAGIFGGITAAIFSKGKMDSGTVKVCMVIWFLVGLYFTYDNFSEDWISPGEAGLFGSILQAF